MYLFRYSAFALLAFLLIPTAESNAQWTVAHSTTATVYEIGGQRFNESKIDVTGLAGTKCVVKFEIKVGENNWQPSGSAILTTNAIGKATYTFPYPPGEYRMWVEVGRVPQTLKKNFTITALPNLPPPFQANRGSQMQ